MKVSYVKQFAWLPTKCYGGQWVWLKHCYQKRIYSEFHKSPLTILDGDLQLAVVFNIKYTEEDTIIDKLTENH